MIFREEAVARVNRIGFGDVHCIKDCVAIEISSGGIVRAHAAFDIRQLSPKRVFIDIGKNHGGFNAKLLTRSNDSDGNLAPIRDQNSFKHRFASQQLIFP